MTQNSRNYIDKRSNESGYRFERKFFISHCSGHEVENMIKQHPSIFSEIFHQRFVNNIYFDSFNLNNYRDNMAGSSKRLKVRIRWYGELFGHIEKPVLEIKLKQGLLGKKIPFPLRALKLDKTNNFLGLVNYIDDSNGYMKTVMKSLNPTLLNRYSRKYYQSGDGHYRITVDTDQVFYRINNYDNLFLNKMTDDINVILELKYNQEHDTAADRVTNHFPFRVTRSSKYVNGLQKVY